jgi:hypothetical protein
VFYPFAEPLTVAKGERLRIATSHRETEVATWLVGRG